MTMISGTHNMQVYRAMVLKSGLGLMAHGIKPNRGWTKKLALSNANAITGKTATSYTDAIAQIDAWLMVNPPKNDGKEVWK